MVGRTAICLLLLGLVYVQTVRSDVISCGGFVKSFIPDVLSKIKVKLLTAEGNLKYETDCTPTNGYYMIPVYTKGSYVIQVEGPTGWVFKPSKFAVTIDGKSDACSKTEDINFHLFGFTVSGRVRSGDLAGPSELDLALYSEDNTLVTKTSTDTTGAYSFEAPPGKYVVSTVDNTQQCIERGSVPIEIKDRSVQAPDIRISGHSLIITVTDEFNKPLNGATVSLLSDQNIPFDRQPNSPKPTASKNGNKWDYRLLTDKTGKVIFPCLPPQTYEVTPSWSTKKAHLSFGPAKRSITIGSDTLEVAFKSNGFDVVGQVQIGEAPLDQVEISVDGKAVAKTDSSGSYKIKALKSGRHTFEAKKEHYKFEPLTLEVNVHHPTLSTISAKKVEVCGHIRFDNPRSRSSQQTQINIFDSKGDLAKKVVVAEGEHHFCTFLAPSTYKLEPTTQESRLNPKFIRIDLAHEPILELVFTEFKATVNGELNCFSQAECADAKIRLLSNSGGEVDVASLQGNKFTFENLIPGRYKVEVTGLEAICLDEDKKSITIESTNAEVSFKQTGYRVEIDSPVELTTDWKQGSQTGSQKLAARNNLFCLPKPGTYTFNLDSCHEFAQGKSFSHTLPSKERLSLRVKSSHFSSSISVDASAPASDFTLTLRIDGNERTLQPLKQGSSKNHTFITSIENEFVGKELELIAKSEKFLFTPESHKQKFDGECSFNKLAFKATTGKYVEGSIEPPVGDVAVKAKHRKDGNVLTSTTNSKGQFRIGLVWNPDDYDVELELEGYKFTATGTKNKFKSVKLSKLVVSYFDQATKKELPEVLISLTGGEDYRLNTVVKENGKITLVDLPVGDYFVRSFLREYQFEPSTTSVQIKEGETADLKLYGNRFAYSAFGKVVTAGGVPLKQVNVEAISQDCGKLQEEDVTDDNGAFRVRGLKPKCTYRLSLRSADGTKLSSIPPFIQIKMEEKDHTDVEFTILATQPLNEIVGIVKFDDEVLRPKTLRVELFENGVNKAHEDLSTGNLFIFNDFITLSNRYQVSVSETDLRNMNAVAEPAEFVADALTKNLLLHIKLRERRPEVETSKNSLVGVLFVLLSAFICLNLSYSKDLFFNAVERTRSAINHQQQEYGLGGQDKRRKTKKN